MARTANRVAAILVALAGAWFVILAEGISATKRNQAAGWYFSEPLLHPALWLVIYVGMAFRLQCVAAWLLSPRPASSAAPRLAAPVTALHHVSPSPASASRLLSLRVGLDSREGTRTRNA